MVSSREQAYWSTTAKQYHVTYSACSVGEGHSVSYLRLE